MASSTHTEEATVKAAQSAVLSVSERVTLCFATLMLAGFLSWSGTALAAVHTISYSNGVDPPIVVGDGDAADVDPDADEIEVHFTLADGVGNDWVASGIILATTTNPAGATFVVTGTTIQNISGQQIIGAQIICTHDFAPFVSLTQQYTAHVDGSFDKIGGGILGNLSLAYSASMTGTALGGQLFMDGLVAAPVLFDWTGLPMHQDTIIQQRQDFTFYMDELDNTINLFNSATILPNLTVGVEETSWGGIKSLFR
jgi:hypothetical protein